MAETMVRARSIQKRFEAQGEGGGKVKKREREKRSDGKEGRRGGEEERQRERFCLVERRGGEEVVTSRMDYSSFWDEVKMRFVVVDNG
jgi:hypothetical protein